MTGGSKSDGVIEMKYTYGAFEDPEVQWEEAKKKAVNRCRQWGYSGARFFESGTRNCISYDQYGSCNRYRVTHKAQCTE